MHTLAQVITAETEAFSAFHQLLLEEHACLSAGDINALAGIVLRKDAQAQRLNELAQERQQSLVAAGLLKEPDASTDWVSRLESNAAQAWRRLLETAEQARQQNQANGGLIDALSDYHHQALYTLQTLAAAEGVYGGDGRRVSGARGRLVGQG